MHMSLGKSPAPITDAAIVDCTGFDTSQDTAKLRLASNYPQSLRTFIGYSGMITSGCSLTLAPDNAIIIKATQPSSLAADDILDDEAHRICFRFDEIRCALWICSLHPQFVAPGNSFGSCWFDWACAGMCVRTIAHVCLIACVAAGVHGARFN